MQTDTDIALRFKNVEVKFRQHRGDTLSVLKDVNVEIESGFFVSIVGPSGCGKTTMLNLAAGLLRASSGSVETFGTELNGINRRASYVFQSDALLPWKTVLANISLGLKFRGVCGSEVRDRSMEWVARLGLSRFANSYPDELSGGMRKRVAIAQAWIVEPELVLMDEPFSMLDVHTRQRVEQEILSLWTAKQKQTVVFVTHDLEEAIALSDEVIVLSSVPNTHVVGRYRIDLPRPRNLLDMKTDSRFIDAYRSIWATIREEVIKSYDSLSNA
jgi:NitT/TauT family transport system ATP-binding protein